MSNDKLWGGRFSAQTDEMVDDFNSSIRFDKRLYKQDIKGSIAHAKMLEKQGIITSCELEKIIFGLNKILEDIEQGKVSFSVSCEDIHMNIEKLLTDLIGEAGKKLHSARSRNDQVALDFKMYSQEENILIQTLLYDLLEVILKLAKENINTIMPGFTHLQKAQPVTFAHHICAYFEMFKRDISRLKDCRERTNTCPLGACALAGTTYNTDRKYVSDLLGFYEPTLNTMDSVSDRDFAIELVSVISTIMMHLSRFSEEIILWCSKEYDYIELDDKFSTGSSIMPQKKNPDIAELVRGKCSRVYGDLMGILTMMKGLPLAYNKDMQEDKEFLFDAVDTVKMCLEVFTKMLSSIKVNAQNMLKSSKSGFLNATDVADYLVKKGIPFRDTHRIAGEIVFYCIQNSKNIEDMTLDEFKSFSELFGDDIYDEISLEACVQKRKTLGGPSSESMSKVIKIYEKFLGER